ncbi:hypothetical protein REPUB_Repub07fG0236800 [Reevesia pubescens]
MKPLNAISAVQPGLCYFGIGSKSAERGLDETRSMTIFMSITSLSEKGRTFFENGETLRENLFVLTWESEDQLLAMLMLSDYVPGSKISALERAFDWNLLASFMLANVLTGLVNLSVDTLFASSVSALLILILNAFTLSVVIGIIDFYGVRLKFW